MSLNRCAARIVSGDGAKGWLHRGTLPERIEKMGKKARIVVVEDHVTTAHALKMFLETQGYIVTIADGVKMALQTVKDSVFDLLICDLSLPDGNGWDLMKQLSDTHPIRGIAFTASDGPEDIARSRNVGFLEHLVKGCPAEEVARAIEQALRVSLKPRPSSRRGTVRRKSRKSNR
jgi:CheY-like chemotaxis protein